MVTELFELDEEEREARPDFSDTRAGRFGGPMLVGLTTACGLRPAFNLSAESEYYRRMFSTGITILGLLMLAVLLGALVAAAV